MSADGDHGTDDATFPTPPTEEKLEHPETVVVYDGDDDTPDREVGRESQGAWTPKPSRPTWTARSVETHYAPTTRERDGSEGLGGWVTWFLDATPAKLITAPWLNGHAFPSKWCGSLPPEKRPETSFEEVERWAGLSFVELAERGVSVPDDTTTDGLARGFILPVDRPPRPMRITLIDWDDVRDPETEEIHPVAAHYIEKYGGYVEISQSGKGLHQLVLGGFEGGRKKLLSTIDDRVFVGDPDDNDDLPMVEVYDAGVSWL